MDIVITISILLGAVFLGFLICLPMIKLTMKMHNARQGERTKFEIDTTDKGFHYYKDIIEKWLNDVGFSKYKSKKNGRYLKYYKDTTVFKFGFNYYQQDNKIIIETWIAILGKESPLTAISHPDDLPNNTLIILDQQRKDEYIHLLKSLMHMPEVIHEKNEVSLLNKINVSDMKSNQKRQKSATIKLVLGIIVFGMLVSGMIYLVDNLNKPKASKDDQNEALQIIQNKLSSFELTKSSHYITSDTLVYTYYGTMKTPESENDSVVIFMIKNNDGEWFGTIQQNKAYGKKWDLNF